MEHFYNNIHGFFDYQELYTYIVNKIPEGSHIVEIGAYKGCSTAYLAVEIINSNKNIKLDVIDSWNGEDGSNRQPWSDYINEIKLGVLSPNQNLFEEFKNNLLPVWNIINPIQSLADDAVKLYNDSSLDFVFIDGNHNYDYVKNDINKWLPKVKLNGILAGHDYYTWADVKKVVHELFDKDKVKIMGNSWMVQL